MKLGFHESGVWQPKSPRQSAVISSVAQNADPHTIPPPAPKSGLLLEARLGLFPDRSIFPYPPASPLQKNIKTRWWLVSTTIRRELSTLVGSPFPPHPPNP